MDNEKQVNAKINVSTLKGLRSVTKDLNLKQIEKLIVDIEKILEEKTQQEVDRLDQKKREVELKKRLKQELKSAGLSYQDLR